jgi:uncharacterized membrane protein
MRQKALWILFVVLAVGIGFYPAIYFIMDRNFGLLGSKSPGLLANTSWNIAFYTHIILGGIALLSGWSQFSTKLRLRNLSLHRRLGKVYVIAVMFSSIAGINIAFFATGGFIPASGFICLGIIWFSTTLLAYTSIRKNQIEQHRKMMVYSYAACFAAVTLRIWLPVLINTSGNFITAYSIVAWLCWVPNVYVAYLITKRPAVLTA